jgi:hypothetical protein
MIHNTQYDTKYYDTRYIVRFKIIEKEGYANGPSFWKKKGSFFWYQLQSIRAYFDYSTYWDVKDGTSISV